MGPAWRLVGSYQSELSRPVVVTHASGTEFCGPTREAVPDFQSATVEKTLYLLGTNVENCIINPVTPPPLHSWKFQYGPRQIPSGGFFHDRSPYERDQEIYFCGSC